MIRKGLAVVVILLFIGLALTPTTYADVDKPELEVIEEDVTPTPIVLVLQLINKLRNHKEIQNVESEDDVLRIIESDEELNSIYEQLFVEDCGCENEDSIGWKFPVFCTVLLMVYVVCLMIIITPWAFPGFIALFIANTIGLIIEIIGSKICPQYFFDF